MVRYLLIASRDTFTARDIDGFYGLAAGLAAQGHPVTVFLVQNAVLSARRGSGAELLTLLARSGVPILAEKFSLRERGIHPDRLATGIESADLGHVVDALADGARVLWS